MNTITYLTLVATYLEHRRWRTHQGRFPLYEAAADQLAATIADEYLAGERPEKLGEPVEPMTYLAIVLPIARELHYQDLTDVLKLELMHQLRKNYIMSADVPAPPRAPWWKRLLGLAP